MEKIEPKKFQTHMRNFLFGNSASALNYKYYQVTSGAQIFSTPIFCRDADQKSPQSDIGLGDSTKLSFEREMS